MRAWLSKLRVRVYRERGLEITVKRRYDEQRRGDVRKDEKDEKRGNDDDIQQQRDKPPERLDRYVRARTLRRRRVSGKIFFSTFALARAISRDAQRGEREGGGTSQGACVRVCSTRHRRKRQEV